MREIDFKLARDADAPLPFERARLRAHSFRLEAHDFERWRPLKRRKPPRCETWAAFTGKTSENRLGDALQLGWIAPCLAHAGQGIDGYALKHLERVVLHRELDFVNRNLAQFFSFGVFGVFGVFEVVSLCIARVAHMHLHSERNDHRVTVRAPPQVPFISKRDEPCAEGVSKRAGTAHKCAK